MALSFYMGHHVPRAITLGLRLRDVNVLTVAEDDANEKEDWELLDRSTTLGRIMFTRDKDFLIEGASRQRAGKFFRGIVYAHQIHVSIGRCVQDLEILAKAGTENEFDNQVIHLPL